MVGWFSVGGSGTSPLWSIWLGLGWLFSAWFCVCLYGSGVSCFLLCLAGLASFVCLYGSGVGCADTLGMKFRLFNSLENGINTLPLPLPLLLTQTTP
jgi:hypothetical protein